MFKKTRIKIFALIMAIATLIITLMLSVVYVANSQYNYQRGMALLDSYMQEGYKGHPDPFDNPNHPMQGFGDKNNDHIKMYNISTFYSVFYNKNGVARINCDGGILYSEQEILDIASNILEEGKVKGTYKKMPFMVKHVNDGLVVALIDNTKEMDNSNRLFQNSLIVGLTGWSVILVLAWFFSKKIVQPLQINDEKQKQFISDASHELKTPIAVVSANAELLAREVGNNKWLNNIQYENERMANLVKQLLQLARVESKKETKQAVNLSQIVSSASLAFESIAYEKGLELKSEIEDNIMVEGIESQLSQLISILLDNSIEHINNGNRLELSLTTVKHQICLSVLNSSKDIPSDVKNRLFERFYRQDEARSDQDNHYGLGLSIAKAIVDNHNGKIEINSGNGIAEFVVTLDKK